MTRRLKAVMKAAGCRLIRRLGPLFLLFALGANGARAQTPCNPNEVTATLDSSGSSITLDHAAIQCNGLPGLLAVNIIDNAPFEDFLTVTYVSGPADIMVGGGIVTLEIVNPDGSRFSDSFFVFAVPFRGGGKNSTA